MLMKCGPVALGRHSCSPVLLGSSVPRAKAGARRLRISALFLGGAWRLQLNIVAGSCAAGII
jgi:hypothetical protein